MCADKTNLLTLRTHQCAFILTLEQINDDAVIPLHIAIPRLLCQQHHLSVPSSLPIWFLYVGFLQNTIKVLVQTVKQERHQLLGVVLLIAAELWGKAL